MASAGRGIYLGSGCRSTGYIERFPRTLLEEHHRIGPTAGAAWRDAPAYSDEVDHPFRATRRVVEEIVAALVPPGKLAPRSSRTEEPSLVAVHEARDPPLETGSAFGLVVGQDSGLVILQPFSYIFM